MRAFLVLSAAVVATIAISAPATAGRPAEPSEQANPAKVEKPACNDHRATTVKAGKAIGARQLAQEPDAQHLQAVVRKLNGCSRPIVLEENVGIRGRSGLIKPVPREMNPR